MNVRDELRDYIRTELMQNPNYPLQDDEAMISGGLIDSFSLVELQLFVEEKFGVWIDDMELTAESANTLQQVVAIVEQRL